MNIRQLLCYPTYNYNRVFSKPNIDRKYIEIDYNKINNMFSSQAIIDFIELITQNFADEDLTNFYNNINDLEIVLNKKILHYDNGYDPVNNKIYLEERTTIVPLFHELFHLASTINKNDVVFCGFSQWGNNFAVGIGLTEGYTQLLSDRLIKEDPGNFKHGYIDLLYYSKIVELIVGVEKMSHLYLTSDLKGLIDELNRYATKEEIMGFITMMDHINASKICDSNLKGIEKTIKYQLLIMAYKYVKRFLLRTYLAKYINLINSQKNIKDYQSVEQLTKELSEHLEEVIYGCNYISIKNSKKQVEILSNKEIEKIMKNSLGVQRSRILKK